MFGLFKAPDLRNKILFTLFILLAFRLLAHIPAPGVNVAALRELLQKNAVLGLFNLFSGGGFQNFSIVTLGLNPYINASIILQLLTMVFPQLEELSKESSDCAGEGGQYQSFVVDCPLMRRRIKFSRPIAVEEVPAREGRGTFYRMSTSFFSLE